MSQELIEGVLAAIPLPAVMVDQTERFIAVNVEGATLLWPQIVGRHFATILRQPSVTTAIENSLLDRQPRFARHLSNDGAQDTTFEVALRYVAGVGAVKGGAVLVCFTDITDQPDAAGFRRQCQPRTAHTVDRVDGVHRNPARCGPRRR